MDGLKPLCVVCDIDGVLADCRHRLRFVEQKRKDYISFYDFMYRDPPKKEFIRLMSMLSSLWPVILVTGRPETHREMTKAWLEGKLAYEELHMREERDFRPAVEVKAEMLDKVRETYEPWVALEDDQKVVAMYREQGLPCVKVEREK